MQENPVVNKYTAAVDYIESYIEATDAVFQKANPLLDGMEDELQYCLNVLKGQEDYLK